MKKDILDNEEVNLMFEDLQNVENDDDILIPIKIKTSILEDDNIVNEFLNTPQGE